MQWLNKILDEITTNKPDGEILVESGISPSGSYHLGYLREILICDAIVQGLRDRGRKARHIHFVDDQDAFRKVPPDLPSEYNRYLGKPLYDIPAPDDVLKSYADYRLQPFLDSLEILAVEIDVIRSHQKYRSGFFIPAIELALAQIEDVKKILETVSGHKIGEEWSPIQINEGGYLKKRPFVAIQKSTRQVCYLDKDKNKMFISYEDGKVKLDWRLDWPARWWLLGIDIEPSGRDHSTKGGSYDTGSALVRKIYNSHPPIGVPYEFINLSGQTKKMSASVGNVIELSEVVDILPPEVTRYFIFRSPPGKTLVFDPVHVSNLIDEFAHLLAKPRKNTDEKQLLRLSLNGLKPVVSSIPFSQLVASYLSALGQPKEALKIIARTSDSHVVEAQRVIIMREFKFIEKWLNKWAPEEVKFNIEQDLTAVQKKYKFSQTQRNFLINLAELIDKENPTEGDGEWFHKAIYKLKEDQKIETQQVFEALYHLLIGKDSGPRAGWFLSILPRRWLIKRLKFEE
jgi:lysyl-tRNA synthetase class 1